MYLWTAQFSFCGKLASEEEAGGFLSSLPALTFYSWLISLASPAKAHYNRRQQAAARQTDKWSNRVDGQTPTAASLQPGQLSGTDTTQQPWPPGASTMFLGNH